MIKVRQVKVSVTNKGDEEIKKSLIRKLKINENELLEYFIRKESIDARDKENIYYSYEIDCNLTNEDLVLNKINKDVEKTIYKEYSFTPKGEKKLENRPVIVGMGPCGLFAAYTLLENGIKPIIIEQGEPIEERVKTVEEFWNSNKLNKCSNVSFGEGGAGTFSDGKLNTLVKDNTRISKVFDVFVKCGAPKEIKYLSKPHIGTDLLRKVIINMREEMIKMGADIRYNTKLTDLIIQDDHIKGIIVNNEEKIDTEVLILAIGHSSRDTFYLLNDKKLNMESKPFAVGFRVMHNQEMINNSQYGKFSKYLPNASYKLTYNTKEGRGVYSFCMCPGGYVVNASSEENRLCINGMSNHDRDSKIANSAIVVTISSKDYGEDLFDGVKFQRELEEKSYNLGNGLIPIQLYKDFKDNIVSENFMDVVPEFKGSTKFSNLNMAVPEFISSSIKEGMEYFGTKIDGFNNDATVLASIESRTSSPIRIIRDDAFESNIKGIYPAGEGAGYAGGITTAAVDGIKASEAILNIYKE